jgi:hypothetical protein
MPGVMPTDWRLPSAVCRHVVTPAPTATVYSSVPPSKAPLSSTMIWKLISSDELSVHDQSM